ncbi:ATP-binding protein [Candidatus Dependentiae bacterium]|nr:ATP-binding protein [Candidatus Dependentiae bacterium]
MNNKFYRSLLWLSMLGGQFSCYAGDIEPEINQGLIKAITAFSSTIVTVWPSWFSSNSLNQPNVHNQNSDITPSLWSFIASQVQGYPDEEYGSENDNYTVYSELPPIHYSEDDVLQKGVFSTIIDLPEYLLKKSAQVYVGEAGEQLTSKVIKPAIDEMDARIVAFKNDVAAVDKILRERLWQGSVLLLGVVCVYSTIKFLSGHLDEYINRPRIVYTKSFIDPSDTLMKTGFRDMVFSPELRNRLNSLLMSTEMMTRKKALENDEVPFRNMVFCGPHGSGKHMFAQELARFARMDFYEIKSSSLVKFKNNDAEIALNDFFREVERNSRPAVIYIDHAAVLFSKYMADNPSDVGRMIRLFVEKNERRSSNFMLIVGVTEKPGFDNDMSSIIDDVIEFNRPGLDERIKILELYRDKLFLTANDVKPSFAALALEFLNDSKISYLAEQLDKFTVADIVSFMKSMKDESQLPYEGMVSESIINRVLERTVSKYVNDLIPAG